ncbi:hypothetical protein M9H77_04374 [Catharanthus roseus]|uniref:Uncharacterized protein n=1 Tax=Catharanthus roseus TaxID=4058 RepID=A0ACC0CDZ7_CATRO|nr:hypothetical protein M9H77_04374 [Catharanthus roseus]
MECCVDLGLVDMNYTGPHFAWTNRAAWSKINRALCNNSWFTSSLNATSNFFISGCFSDHYPCVVYLFEQMDRPRPRFMFFNMWVEYEDFGRMVEDNWRMLIPGTKQFALCRKLKMLKKGFMELNRKHFAHISAKAEAARADLKHAKTDLYERPLDDRLKEEVRQIQNKVVFLINVERKFFAQKIKGEFLFQGDKGTRVFHSLVKRNAKRNYIASITREDGTYTTNGKEVQDEFISFYGKLLGTRQGVSGFDDYAMGTGPKISPTQAADWKLLDRWCRASCVSGLEYSRCPWQCLTELLVYVGDFYGVESRPKWLGIETESSIGAAKTRIAAWANGELFTTTEAYAFMPSKGRSRDG